MRTVISNNEQTAYIRKRQPFRTRTIFGYFGPTGGVYEGIVKPGGYELWHWNTLIATFSDDGDVWMNPGDYSMTTGRYKSRIYAAMTPDERRRADAASARAMHADAADTERRHGRHAAIQWHYGNRAWRARLARYDYALA